MHWFDELFGSVLEALGDRERAVCNAGLSVSGLQHVGRLRGEIVLNHLLAEGLRRRRREVLQHLVLYTQDPWKGSPRQRAEFPGDEGSRYVSWRLIDVPDPRGCHANWVQHYWADFADSLPAFAPGIVGTTTTDLYRRPEMKGLVRELAARAEEVRQLVNRYRPRNPHPEGWIPFEPLCLACRRIGQARALALKGEEVEYACACGETGRSSIELGKLNWRLEWPALWAILEVDVEPFGKDHAAPGGSRESCQVIARTILHREAPFGIAYEWVGYAERGEDRGDMGSSDFLGFGPAAWLEVADPEVLRFLFAQTPHRRRLVLDLSRVDAYHDAYDQAEAAAHADGTEEGRSYVLAQLAEPPADPTYRLPYRHAALLAQMAPPEDLLAWSLRRLEDTGVLDRELTPWEAARVERRLRQARTWARAHAPPELRVDLREELPPEAAALPKEERDALGILADRLQGVPWREETIKEAMIGLTGGKTLSVSTERFFAALYTALLGEPRGPRAAPLLSVLDRDFVLRRLEEARRG